MEINKNSKLLNIKAGQFLKSSRINKGMTGQELGHFLSVSQQQVSRYENGKNKLTIEMLNLMFNHLDISWKDFVNNVIEDQSYL